nr:hypothetical protein [Desulfovibrio sp. TomC]
MPSFLGKRLHDQLVLLGRMATGSGLFETLSAQDFIEFHKILCGQSGREELFPDQADLPFHLAFLPAGGWRAGHRLEQVVGTELFKALVEVPILADEDLLHGSLHVVVDAAPRDAAEELESPHVGVENHLLGFSRVGDDKTQPAVAEPDMRHLHPRRQSAEQDVLMAPIELKRFSRRENQGNESLVRQKLLFTSPCPDVALHIVIGTSVAFLLDLLVKSFCRMLLSLWKTLSSTSRFSKDGINAPSMGLGWIRRS